MLDARGIKIQEGDSIVFFDRSLKFGEAVGVTNTYILIKLIGVPRKRYNRVNKNQKDNVLVVSGFPIEQLRAAKAVGLASRQAHN